MTPSMSAGGRFCAPTIGWRLTDHPPCACCQPATFLGRGQSRVAAKSSMSRRRPPISWWLRSNPSRWNPEASATRRELVFHGSMYSSTRCRAGMVQAKESSAVVALLATPRPRCRGATENPAVARPSDSSRSHSPIVPTAGAGVPVDDDEGQAASLGEPALLTTDPLQGLPRRGPGDQCADEPDVRIGAELDRERHIVIGERAQHHRPVRRRGARPGRQGRAHALSVAETASVQFDGQGDEGRSAGYRVAQPSGTETHDVPIDRSAMVRRECALTHSRAPQLRPSQAQPAPP